MAVSSARTPAIAVTVNGLAVDGAIDAEIFSNSHLASDRFRLRLALDASSASIWSSASLRVGIQLGLDGSWETIFLGQADVVEIDPIHGVVSVEGRDLAALLIEARTQETFENQTASDIAMLLAGRHGLTANVTVTSRTVGRDFQSQRARTTLDQHSWITTEWDLLTQLAKQEGFDVWIDQETLNFVAPSLTSFAAITPEDCIALRLERTLGLEGDLSVAVKSWDCRGEAALTQTASNGGGNDAPRYVVIQPNVTAEVAQAFAQRLLGEMARHGRIIDIDMPGELNMRPRAGLALSGTGTDFDNTYTISDVERRISFEHGFTQNVRARLPWIASST